MAVYVAVLGTQGIVEDVSVHRTRRAAMQRVDAHLDESGISAQRWFRLLRQANDYPDEDYEPTNLYVCDLED